MNLSNSDLCLALSHNEDLSLIEKAKLLKMIDEKGSDFETALAAVISRQEKKKATLDFLQAFPLAEVKSHLLEDNISYLDYFSPDYPVLLKEIYEPPVGLFYQGDLGLLDYPPIAIVGSRDMNLYAKRVIRQLLPEILSVPMLIVSGMARGVDSFVHETTISLNQKTVGVLGCGLNQVYPKENAHLQDRMAREQLLVTEYPPNTAPFKQNFPHRNRIIAGLSLGTLVIQAKERSGSLITANIALQEGREVFAVPGDIDFQDSKGCNQLIQAGAKLVINGQDIIEELEAYLYHHLPPSSKSKKE